MKDIIAKDLDLSTNELNNSNIIALVATLLVRLVAGPLCDRFGPRYVFAGCLLIGAIPTFLAGTAYTVAELYALRFFIGILGGSFVPCQVWTTAFFDKNIVGTANALTAGFGNSGGGVTYFIMPAVFTSLVTSQGLTPHTAWRVAFVVPGIVIVFVAACLLLLCPDTPTGKWSERVQAAENNLHQHGVEVSIANPVDKHSNTATSSPPSVSDEEKKDPEKFSAHEAHLSEQQMVDVAKGEIVEKPTWQEMMRVILTPQTFVTGACYFCTFGTELSVNIILGNYYSANFPSLSVTESGSWAAMFGLMNIVVRPAGGIVADLAYKKTGSVWAKKVLLHTYSILVGVFLIAIGVSNPHKLTTLTLLVGIGLSFFVGGANGINYALVPHVYPYANGIVSGFTGASGNFGGVIFTIIFRYMGTDYAKAMWIIGIIVISINVLVSWIRPVPKL